MNRKILSLITAGVLSAAVLTGCGKEKSEKDSVKIAYLPITHSLAVLEEAEELEKQNGIKVELVKFGSWPELLDALNSNKVDGASVLIELAMKSKLFLLKLKTIFL